MGWWHEDILGGDTPHDIAGYLFEVVDKQGRQKPEAKAMNNYAEHDQVKIDPEWYNHGFELKDIPESFKLKLKNYLNGNQQEVYKLLAEDLTDTEDKQIVWQILAYYSLGLGTAIELEAKKQMLKVAKEDEWANSHEQDEDSIAKRQFMMDELAKALKTYTGEPIVLDLELKNFSKSRFYKQKPTDISEDVANAEIYKSQQVFKAFDSWMQSLEPNTKVGFETILLAATGFDLPFEWTFRLSDIFNRQEYVKYTKLSHVKSYINRKNSSFKYLDISLSEEFLSELLLGLVLYPDDFTNKVLIYADKKAKFMKQHDRKPVPSECVKFLPGTAEEEVARIHHLLKKLGF